MTRMRPYVVRQGDYLARIAYRRNCRPKFIWQHESNAEIKGRRQDPEVLLPGDVLHAPESARRAHSIQSGMLNRFRAQVPRNTVNIQLENEYGPRKNIECKVEVGLNIFTATTNADGVLILQVPLTESQARITIACDTGDSAYVLQFGHMNPADDLSGVISRLVHLGYLLPREILGESGYDEDDIAIAVLQFQSDHGLSTSHGLDNATLLAIREFHGS